MMPSRSPYVVRVSCVALSIGFSRRERKRSVAFSRARTVTQSDGQVRSTRVTALRRPDIASGRHLPSALRGPAVE